MEEDLAVVVLAGGEGRRIGGGKPLLMFHGAPLLAHALSRARGWSRVVAVAVRKTDQAGGVEARLILDDPTIGGPAAGLSSAFAFAAEQGASRVLTLPCDVPRLPADLPARPGAALAGGAGRAVAPRPGRPRRGRGGALPPPAGRP